MAALTLYDTFSKSMQPFVPRVPGQVGMYTCGPTVYARQHIGNLRTYLFADLLKRTLSCFGYRVRHVMNITDVGHLTDDEDAGEDKVERAAREQSAVAHELTERWTRAFRDDLAALDVLPADVVCRASEHIDTQIAMIQTLERKGFVYPLADGLYFDTAKDPSYGALSGLSASADKARVKNSGEKLNPADFALWKLSPPEGPRRQLEWDSPWGRGFPGWHIECSAMATKYLGAEFDIHTGGIDHVPVHHTNEIAQSENALGVRPWVRYWMHAGWLLMSGGKISKSAGRATTLDDLRNAGIGPMAFRYYMLTAHYRKPLEFSMEALRGASAAFERLRGTVREHSAPASASDDETSTARDHRTRFLEALADDLSAPRALAVLWNIVRDPRLGGVERAALVGELAPTLGLDLRGPGAERTEPRASDGTVERLLAERSAARQRRDFVLADALRAELQGLGVHLHDDRVNSDWSGGRDEHYGRDRQPKRVGNGHET